VESGRAGVGEAAFMPRSTTRPVHFDDLIRCRERSLDHQIPRVERALYAMPALIRLSRKFADQNGAHSRRIDVIHVR
jgi:hypothetical protein